jgi:hypothetical protein
LGSDKLTKSEDVNENVKTVTTHCFTDTKNAVVGLKSGKSEDVGEKVHRSAGDPHLPSSADELSR